MLSHAAILYGVDSASDSLFQINPSTGTTTLIGSLDPLGNSASSRYATPIAMAIRPSDQKIFVYNNSETLTNPAGVTTGDVLTVDPLTGAATAVGGPSGVTMQALAFSPGGQLYGFGENGLHSIDDTTGVLTFINMVTAGQQVLRPLGADFNSAGVLYVAALDANSGTGSSLYTVDPLTAQATLVAAVAFPAVPGSIVFAPGGNLLGSDIDGNLFDIDPTTGALSNFRVLANSNGSQGLGFVVPETSTWLLTSGALGLLLLRRRCQGR